MEKLFPIKGFPSIGFYAMNITLEFMYSIFLGVIVNQVSNIIARQFGLDINGKMIVQLILIIIILYHVKKYLLGDYGIWQEYDKAGVVFISLFLSSQSNIRAFVQNMYDHL